MKKFALKPIHILLIAGMTLAQISAPAHSDEPAAQGGEPVKLQTRAKPAATSNLPAMPERPETTRMPVSGALMDKPETFKKTRAAASATATPATAMPSATQSSTAQSSKSIAGQGAQQPAKATTPTRVATTESHIQLVMEVNKNGESKILSAVTLPGAAPLTNEVRGDFVYSMALGNEIIGVQAIPDPFEMRAFPPPQDNGVQGHHFEQAQTARIVMTLPKATAVQQRMDQLQLKFYKWKPAAHVHSIDINSFQQSLKNKELEKVVDIPAKTLSPQLKQSLKTLQ